MLVLPVLRGVVLQACAVISLLISRGECLHLIFHVAWWAGFVMALTKTGKVLGLACAIANDVVLLKTAIQEVFVVHGKVKVKIIEVKESGEIVFWHDGHLRVG